MDVFGWVLAFIALVGGATLAFRKKALEKQLSDIEAGRAALQKELEEVRARNTELSRFESVLDAEAWASETLRSAEEQRQAMLRQAHGEAELLRQKAEASLVQARNEAEKLVSRAREKAREIAGEALAAVDRARELEQTAEAMRNIIDGYGDRYLIPSRSLLDELGESFSFEMAGEKLTQARLRTRQMVDKGQAAECDYVETNRRKTAIDFVVDAFNGKVDTILAEVRTTNFGTLQRKITDAFALVNHNGRAFKNARILPGYVEARIEELRWAVATQELRQKEKEEQRRIKEQIREEERAQREFERAQREAEKEESMLRKAMEKARREFEGADASQKRDYERRLRDLEERLRTAEEKGERALSMAQQTRAGHVYVISNVGSFGDGVIKVGLTRRLEPFDRIRELGDASVPFEFDVHAMIRSEDAPTLERELHSRFEGAQVNKVNPRKEFFRLPLQVVRDEVERLGLNARWTMTAAAKEYRESLVLGRKMGAPVEQGLGVGEEVNDTASRLVADARSRADVA